MEVLTLISQSLSRVDSWVSRMASTDGFAAAFDTITSIFPYFCVIKLKSDKLMLEKYLRK